MRDVAIAAGGAEVAAHRGGTQVQNACAVGTEVACSSHSAQRQRVDIDQRHIDTTGRDSAGEVISSIGQIDIGWSPAIAGIQIRRTSRYDSGPRRLGDVATGATNLSRSCGAQITNNNATEYVCDVRVPRDGNTARCPLAEPLGY